MTPSLHQSDKGCGEEMYLTTNVTFWSYFSIAWTAVVVCVRFAVLKLSERTKGAGKVINGAGKVIDLPRLLPLHMRTHTHIRPQTHTRTRTRTRTCARTGIMHTHTHTMHMHMHMHTRTVYYQALNLFVVESYKQ